MGATASIETSLVSPERAEISRNTLLGEESVRRLWAGVFRNASEAGKDECLGALERNFDKSLSMGGPSVTDAREADWNVCLISRNFHNRLKHKSLSPLTQFEEGEVIVIPNLVSGYIVAPLTWESLVSLDRTPTGYAFVGWSRNGLTCFDDGTAMKHQFYVPTSHLEFLLENTDKVALTVDDCEESGGTRKALCDSLRQIGFTRICNIAYDGSFHMATH